MGLIRNFVGLSTNPGRIWAGLSQYAIAESTWLTAGGMRNFCAGEGTVVNGASVADTSARPNGYQGEACWLLAIKGGGFSAYTSFVHPNVFTAHLSLGGGIESTMTADGSLSATMQALANLVSTMTANDTLTAAMQAFANLSSTMTATTDLSATLSAFANMLATLTADGSITTAELSLIVGLACTMVSDGSISTANLTLLVGLACTMLSDCALTGDMQALANLASTMLANGDLTGALSALSNLNATMIADGSLTGALRGTASMSAVMTTEGGTTDCPTAAQNAAAVWSYILSGVITTATAEECLTRITLPTAIPVTSAVVVADGGNLQGYFKTALLEATSDYWKDALVTFATGALAGQVKKVLAYDGVTKFLTVGPSPGFTGTPAPGDVFVLINH